MGRQQNVLTFLLPLLLSAFKKSYGSSVPHSSFCAQIVASVSANCVKTAPIKLISSADLFSAIQQASAVTDAANSHDFIESTLINICVNN